MHRKYSFKILALAGVLGITAIAAAADFDRLRTSVRYDQEYPVIGYSGPATHNRIWQLQQKMQSGEVKLAWEPGFGYLRSLLQALQIDTDSQVLVFSRTSLQVEHIDARTPRAVYFNDDTYVGYVQDTPLIEITSIDSQKGAVFYAFDNRQEGTTTHIEREGGRCLSCHDTFSMTGGGVPRVMVMSAPVDNPLDTRTYTAADETDDKTPIAERWGGWYVTGRTGTQSHFGNLPLREERAGERLRELQGKRMNLASLKDYLDVSRWPTDQSDVVALLVLEHQTALQNMLTRVNYKVRTVMSRADDASITTPRSWDEVNPSDQKRVQQMMEPLVRALFFKDAAPYGHRIESGNGFAARFAKLGPRDSRGRSLRELDLTTRLPRYPLSYMIYSEQFDGLPQFALDYVNERIVEVLQGKDTTGIAARLTAAERKAITEILLDTKPALAALLKARASG